LNNFFDDEVSDACSSTCSTTVPCNFSSPTAHCINLTGDEVDDDEVDDDEVPSTPPGPPTLEKGTPPFPPSKSSSSKKRARHLSFATGEGTQEEKAVFPVRNPVDLAIADLQAQDSHLITTTDRLYELYDLLRQDFTLLRQRQNQVVEALRSAEEQVRVLQNRQSHLFTYSHTHDELEKAHQQAAAATKNAENQFWSAGVAHLHTPPLAMPQNPPSPPPSSATPSPPPPFKL
jgi:hypothetical protein